MKRLTCLLLICTVTLCSCAGSGPHPVAEYRPGDENKSCSALKAEIANIDKRIKVKGVKKTEKDFGNVLNFVCGFIVIVPWFFMDLKNAEQVEIDALQQRKDALCIIAKEKNCKGGWYIF